MQHYNIHECETAIAAARANRVAPLAKIVERERRWFAQRLLLGRKPESGVSQWLLHEFCCAARDGNAAEFRLLISVGAHGASRHRGILPLHLAAFFGFVEGAELLIAAGANVTSEACGELTPLHIASHQARPDLIKILLAHGSSINAVDARLMTPLQRLVNGTAPTSRSSDVPKAMEVLLTSGAHTTATAPSSPPLNLAVMNASATAVIMLVEHGADVMATDSNGNTPLHCFWRSRLSLPELESVLATLIRHGANPKALNMTNQSPSQLAAMIFQPDIVNLLVRYGG